MSNKNSNGLWLPIETAPRYGRILVKGTDIGVCVASAGWPADKPDEIRWEVVNDVVVNPTHWMPIPEGDSHRPIAKVCHKLSGHIGWNPDLESLPDEGTPLYSLPPSAFIAAWEMRDAIIESFTSDDCANAPWLFNSIIEKIKSIPLPDGALQVAAWVEKDVHDRWSHEIDDYHPIKTKAFDAHAKAMEMVGNRRSKGALVSLVCWLLQKVDKAKEAHDDELEAMKSALALLNSPVDSIAEMYCFGMGDCDETRQALKDAIAKYDLGKTND